MHHSSSTNNKNFVGKSMWENSHIASRETAFNPMNYEFDTGTMVEPFTYFHDGPTESRRKPTEYSSSTLTNFPWLSTHHHSVHSSPDESPQSSFSPITNEQFKIPPNLHPQPQLKPSPYPKTICRHCKSHNMPECLYTSHTMYDESGAIFCPVLKKCHCATCIRATNSNNIRDDDSDDEINIRFPTISHEFSHVYGIYPRPNSYRLNNNNNF